MLFRRSGDEIDEEKKLFSDFKRIETFMKKQQADQSRALNIIDSISDDYGAPPRKRRRKNSKLEEVEDTSAASGGRGGRRDRGKYEYIA